MGTQSHGPGRARAGVLPSVTEPRLLDQRSRRHRSRRGRPPPRRIGHSHRSLPGRLRPSTRLVLVERPSDLDSCRGHYSSDMVGALISTSNEGVQMSARRRLTAALFAAAAVGGLTTISSPATPRQRRSPPTSATRRTTTSPMSSATATPWASRPGSSGASEPPAATAATSTAPTPTGATRTTHPAHPARAARPGRTTSSATSRQQRSTNHRRTRRAHAGSFSMCKPTAGRLDLCHLALPIRP